VHNYKQECEEPNTEDISAEFFDSDSSVQWYVAIRCAEMFRTKNNRYPGDITEHIESDVEEMKEYALKIVSSLGADESFEYNNDHLHEIARYSNSCLHNISALLGGVASQEAVKLITMQYTPLNHTFIFDGAHTKSQVFNP
jgi:amyloid beta precursor protein binding protein 1